MYITRVHPRLFSHDALTSISTPMRKTKILHFPFGIRSKALAKENMDRGKRQEERTGCYTAFTCCKLVLIATIFFLVTYFNFSAALSQDDCLLHCINSPLVTNRETIADRLHSCSRASAV